MSPSSTSNSTTTAASSTSSSSAAAVAPTTAATGPHRFRSSAASFSPSQPSNIQLHQQQQQQQQHQHQYQPHAGAGQSHPHPLQSPQSPHLIHQQQAAAVAAQQQMYQQYMYAGVPPPMSVNPYFPQYIPQNPYMPIPAAYNQFVNPYNQPYSFGQPPTNAYNGGYSGGMHNKNGGGYNGYNKYHKGGRRDRVDNNNNNNNNNNYSGNHSAAHNSTTTNTNIGSKGDKDQIVPETPETTPASSTPPASTTADSSISTSSSSSSASTPAPQFNSAEQSKTDDEKESTQKEASTVSPAQTTTTASAETDAIDTQAVPPTTKTPEKKPQSSLSTLPSEDYSNAHLTYPIYFNVKPTDFATEFKSGFEDRANSQKSKSEKLSKETDGVVIIRRGANEGTEEVIEYKGEDSKKASANVAAGQHNWADVLQKRAAAAKKVEKASSTQQQPRAAASAVAATSASTLSKDTSLESDSAVTADKPGSPSTFPLGVVLLKLMFVPSYSPFSHEFPIFKIKPRGLTNTGNICYMNAVLQALLYCEPFNRLLKLVELKAVGSLSTTSPTPLLDMTIGFFREFSSKQPSQSAMSSSGKALSPEKFYFQLIKLSKFSHLKWGQQEDAEEFLGYFLDGIHEEFVTALKALTKEQVEAVIQENNSVSNFKLNVKNTLKVIQKTDSTEGDESDSDSDSTSWNEVAGGGKKAVTAAKRTVEIEPTPITSLFGGQFRSVLTIPKSKESQSITLDPFQCIQLDISDSRISTIEDAFKIFNESENIPYKTSTSSNVIAKKQTFIDQLPNVMTIHLKRFSYDSSAYNGSLGVGKSNTSGPNGSLSNDNELNDNNGNNFSFANANNNTNNKNYNNNNNNNNNNVGSNASNSNTNNNTNDDMINGSGLNSPQNGAIGGVGKLLKKVKYSHTFTIPSECISSIIKKQQSNISKTYRLIGVVYHHGNSTDGGHYTCDVLRRSSVFDEEDELAGKKFDNEWIRIDDTQVQQIDKLDVLNGEEGSKTAYILIYQKI